MNKAVIDLSNYRSRYGFKHRFVRALWSIVWTLFARPLPRSMGGGWKRFLLRLFGAKIPKTSNVYSSAKIFWPANLIMGEYSCIDSNVNFYNVDKVYIGDNTTISQGAFICPGSHDISDPMNPMICKPMYIEDQVWIASEAFVGGSGIRIGQGAVVGARAAVFKDVEPWTVVGGNPAKFLKMREIKAKNTCHGGGFQS